MRTTELWIDLYGHRGAGEFEDSPVWGHWRCVAGGRVLWQASGYLVTDDAGESSRMTVAMFRSFMDPSSSRGAEVLFPCMVISDASGVAGSHYHRIHEMVAKTVDDLVLNQCLAIGLCIDPALAGSAEVYPAQLLSVPSTRSSGTVARRTDVCIVQLQQTDRGHALAPVPGWELIRVLEISSNLDDHSWHDDLAKTPLVDLRTCDAADLDAVKELLASFRPHVIVCHEPSILRGVKLRSPHIVVTVLPPGTSPPPYRALADLMDRGASTVLVCEDMARSKYARLLVDVLCQHGTLTDALLELHHSPGSDHDVTVCSRDLRLKLRSGEGHPAPRHPAGGTVGTASAWIPLGARLRGISNDYELEVVALSGRVVCAEAQLSRPTHPTPFTLRGVSDPNGLIAKRCKELLADGVCGEVTVTPHQDIPSPAATEAALQACMAAVSRALDGGDLERDGYLLVPRDLIEGAEQGDPIVATSSPVLVAGRPVGSIPWTADLTRTWRHWDYAADGFQCGLPRVVLPPSAVTHGGTTCDLEAVARRTGQQLRELRRQFDSPASHAVGELAEADMVLVTGTGLMWPTRNTYELTNTRLVAEA